MAGARSIFGSTAVKPEGDASTGVSAITGGASGRIDGAISLALGATGGWNVRYRTGQKGRYVTALTDLIADRLPTCRVRYAF